MCNTRFNSGIVTVFSENRALSLVLVHENECAGMRAADATDILDYFLHLLLVIAGAIKLDTCIENCRSCLLRQVRHLGRICSSRNYLGISAVINVSFICEREQIEIKPEIKSVRMNIGVNRCFLNSGTITYRFKIEVCREIILIAAAGNKLIAHQLGAVVS